MRCMNVGRTKYDITDSLGVKCIARNTSAGLPAACLPTASTYCKHIF